MTAVRTIAWIFGVIYASVPPYWIIVHAFAPDWRKRNAKLKHIGPIWFVLWLVIGGVTWKWRLVALYTTVWTWIPAVALIAVAYGIYRQAMRDFTNDQVVGRSELEATKHEQRLNTRGIRARLRHPLYLGHLLHVTGWTIGSGLAVLWCLLPFTIVTGALMVRAEERELLVRFGEEYREYRRRVPMLLPRL
jgi:protein-S-isoprenylcysteine O-methyltransferase Ste14